MSTNSLFVCYPSENFENVVSEKKKATSKRSKKVSLKRHSSHNKYTAQDILDVTKWQQEKWPNKSIEFNNKRAIHLLNTSHHSLAYLKGNAAARADWVKISARNKMKLSNKTSKTIKEKFENDDTTPSVTEPPTYTTKSTYIPFFNMSYHTDDNKNRQLCFGNTCITKDNISSLLNNTIKSL
jgi:hypothetical protein